MRKSLYTRAVLLTAASALAIPLAACGSSSGSTVASGSSAPMSSSTSSAMTSANPASGGMPFGAGCSAVPSSGKGSFQGMSTDPVATAASNNPALSTLVSAVGQAGLADSLNSASNITVLAPANPAFQAVPASDLQALLADKTKLTAVLTHHVIQGRLSPDQLAGTHTTLAGDKVTIQGSGQDFSIDKSGTVLGQTDAHVICGNVQTANATVYIIDQVLKPGM